MSIKRLSHLILALIVFHSASGFCQTAPDRILFRRITPTATQLLTIAPGDSTEVLVYTSPDIGEYAEWSPNQESIVFNSNQSTTGVSEVFVLDIATSTVEQITSFGHGGCHRAQFRNATEIWFAIEVGNDSTELFSINLDGSDISQLSDFAADSSEIGGFDFDNEYIYYDKQQSGDPNTDEIFRAHIMPTGEIDWSSEQQLTTNAVRDHFPVLSRDGTKLAFWQTGADGSRPHNVLISDTSGSGQVQITFAQATEEYNYPIWSPDGLQIVCSHFSNGERDLFLLDPNGVDDPALLVGSAGNPEIPCDWQGPYVNGSIYLFLADGSPLHPCDSEWVEQPVACNNIDYLKGANVAFKIPDGVLDVSASFTGYATESWLVHDYEIDTIANAIIVYVSGGDILPGNTELFGLRFRTDRLCREERHITWDTALSDDPNRMTFLVGADFENFEPTFDTSQNKTEIAGYEPGDVTGDDKVNLADITCLINQVYINKDSCCLWYAGRLNSDSNINLGDITLLIDHVYISKNPLNCWTPPSMSKANRVADINLQAIYSDGKTEILVESDQELKGIHVELSGPTGLVPLNLCPERLDLIYGEYDGNLVAGLFDMDGAEVIQKGKSRLIQVNGEYHLVYAEAVTSDFEVVVLGANSVVSDLLPNDFMLYQNYPNPFNPTTTIQFEMPQASVYSMTIYNVAGQVVEEQAGYAEAGPIYFEWNATDRASGVYFYRVQVGDLTETKKMVLLK